MRTLINKNGIEKLLASHWSAALDRDMVLVEVLKSIRDNDLPTIEVASLPEQKGMQVSTSRFEIGPQGYTLWVEFRVPNNKQVAVGTLELEVSHSGVIQRRETTGHVITLLNS